MEAVFNLNPAEKKDFAGRLLTWFDSAMRPLPWRETYTPYDVWISEIMLQQTQMERGVRYYNAWKGLFPDIRSVAEADEEAVLKAWEGLGYYSRARNLHATAKIIMNEHNGVFPCVLESIRALPGVGEYTAAAIASIAFNMPEPAVDANVLRIFARICDIGTPVSSIGMKVFITDTVKSLMPGNSPRLLTQALMEFGALICSKTPQCGGCPLAKYCEARRLNVVAERPRRKDTVKSKYLDVAAGLVMREGRVLIQKRPPNGVWAGLWEFPGGCLKAGETPEKALLREMMDEMELPVIVGDKIGVVRHSYTTWRVTMHGYFCTLAADEATPVLHAATECKWIYPRETSEYAFPAGHRKILNHLGWGQGQR